MFSPNARARALAVLTGTLPVPRSHDEALNWLYILNVNASEEVRACAQGAAVYILITNPEDKESAR